MNANELHVHQSFQGAVLWGWLKRFPLQFHFIHGLVTTLAVPPRVTQARGSFLAERVRREELRQ